jgi:hypothetical protein
MPKHEHVVTGVMAFGAGVAFGAMLPKAGGWVENILKKLGFEWAELLLLWDPEASARPAKRVKRKKTVVRSQRRIFRRNNKPVRLTAARSSSRAAKAAALRN